MGVLPCERRSIVMARPFQIRSIAPSMELPSHGR